MGEDQEIPILDPNAKEEKVWTSRTTVFTNVFGDVWGIETVGALAITPEVYLNCLTTAEEKAKNITKILRDSIKNKESQQLLNNEFDSKMDIGTSSKHKAISMDIDSEEEDGVIDTATKEASAGVSKQSKNKKKKGKRVVQKDDSDEEVQNLKSEFQ